MVVLLHCGSAENYWEENISYAVDIHNQGSLTKAKRAFLRQSSFEKRKAIFLVLGKAHKSKLCILSRSLAR